MKALVVDDSTLMRKILTGVLLRVKIKDVVHAADGEEAVAACEDQDFAIVLLDWNMPKMSGIDALKAIRAMGKTMPIVMVTSEAQKDRVVEAFKAGANNYIVKPFEPDTIVEMIKDALG